MAKKTPSKKVVDTCCPLPSADYKPSIYLSLEGANQVGQIKGLKLGEKVQVLIEGTVRGLEQRKSMRYRNGKDTEVDAGHIDLEGYTVTVVEDEEDFGKKTGTSDDD